MKNEIDDLLEALFRNGVLSTGRYDRPSQSEKDPPSEPDLQWDPGEQADQAQQALDQVTQAQAAMQQSLQKRIEKLTQDAQAELSELEQNLKEDGVSSAAANANLTPEALDEAFRKARQEAGEQVLGQDAFLDALALAFRRPFVAGREDSAPLGRVLVTGKRGTGRHSAVKTYVNSLARQGVLKSTQLATVDLSRYGAPDSEKLFVQDLYAALKSGAAGLVFENFRECHSSVLSAVAALFTTGEAPLSGRYAEQKGMLVDIGSALVPGAVSSLSARGKYLFLLTDQSQAKLLDAFGMPFVAALDDQCATAAFEHAALEAIARRELEELQKQGKRKLGFSFTYEDSAVQALVLAFHPEEGVFAMQGEAQRFLRTLGEAKLKAGLAPESGVIAGEGKELLLRYETGGETRELRSPAQSDPVGEEALRAVKEELDEIVGLGEIKAYILSLEDHFKLQQLRREQGLKAESPSMHMIFTGNPGTGKTTIARLVSRYLKAIGILSGGQLIEVTRADLVGQYVGHTAPLTQKAIQSALGGVLFIDEAYALYRGEQDSFGLEAIDTLVKGMEDHRDELVVILAGYSYEMEEFLTANSGLRSRFPNIIEFPDYTAQELLDITKSIVKAKGYRLSPDCDQPLLAYYEQQQSQGDPRTNGNGRMARNKVEEAILAAARRALNTPEDQRDLELLLPEDFG